MEWNQQVWVLNHHKMKPTAVCLIVFVVGFHSLNAEETVADLDNHLKVSFSGILFFWLNLIQNFLLLTMIFVWIVSTHHSVAKCGYLSIQLI